MAVTYIKKSEAAAVVGKIIEPANIILDIGSGISPQNWIKPLVHICCEPFKPYIEYLQQYSDQWFEQNYIFLNVRWQELVKIIPSKSVDTAFLLDLIEQPQLK